METGNAYGLGEDHFRKIIEGCFEKLESDDYPMYTLKQRIEVLEGISKSLTSFTFFDLKVKNRPENEKCKKEFFEQLKLVVSCCCQLFSP